MPFHATCSATDMEPSSSDSATSTRQENREPEMAPGDSSPTGLTGEEVGEGSTAACPERLIRPARLDGEFSEQEISA
jgi:hypothetical protein